MTNLTYLERQRFQRDVAHLRGLGGRALGEFLEELALQLGGGPAIARLLAQYRCLTPGMVRVAGADRFPRRQLDRVPA